MLEYFEKHFALNSFSHCNMILICFCFSGVRGIAHCHAKSLFWDLQDLFLSSHLQKWASIHLNFNLTTTSRVNLCIQLLWELCLAGVWLLRHRVRIQQMSRFLCYIFPLIVNECLPGRKPVKETALICPRTHKPLWSGLRLVLLGTVSQSHAVIRRCLQAPVYNSLSFRVFLTI